MADKEEKAVKNEGSNPEAHSDDNVPISAIDKGKGKMVAYDDDDDDDDDEDPFLFSSYSKFSGIKIGEARDNAMPPKAYKKQLEVQKTKNVKVKKVYDLPGQKHDPPEERDPSRIFYESLHKQRPDSEMAAVWMMERGLLPEDEAKEVFEKEKKKGSSPAKSPSTKKSPARSSVKRSLDSSGPSGTKKDTGASKDNSTKNQKGKADSDSEEDDYDFTGRSKLDAKKKQKVSN